MFNANVIGLAEEPLVGFRPKANSEKLVSPSLS